MTLLKVSLIKCINNDTLIKCQDNQFYKNYFSRKCSKMTVLQGSLLMLFKDVTFLNVIKGIHQRWRFRKSSMLVKTYNDRLKDDALEKCHLLPFLTCKKRHCFSFFLQCRRRSLIFHTKKNITKVDGRSKRSQKVHIRTLINKQTQQSNPQVSIYILNGEGILYVNKT